MVSWVPTLPPECEGEAWTLTPLPCKRRSLAEIQSSIGLSSNIQVQVIEFDAQLPSPSPKTGRRKKRKRPFAIFHHHQHQVVGFATVKDSSGTVMILVDHTNRFATFFRTARDSGGILLLTHVVSKKQSDLYGKPLSTEETVLWPTRTTSATLLSASNNNPPKACARLYSGELSQDCDDTVTQTQRVPSYQSEVKTVSKMLDLSINGKSIMRSSMSFQTLRSALLTANGTFASASIVLEHTTSLAAVGLRKGTVLHANSSIVRSLCGGITPKELTDECDSNVAQHALNLFRALLSGRVSLQWTIDTSSLNLATIRRVTLPTV